MTRKCDEFKLKRMMDYIAKGLNAKSIADAEGQTVQSVYGYCRRHGMKVGGEKLTMRKLAGLGYTAPAAAKLMGVCNGTAYSAARTGGFKFAQVRNLIPAVNPEDALLKLCAVEVDIPASPKSNAAKRAKAQRMIAHGHPVGVAAMYSGLDRHEVVGGISA